ncbi:hypothetical protein Tco_0448702 [Tanacetum coccineum]
MDAVVSGVVVLTFDVPLVANVITYLGDDSREYVLQLLSDNDLPPPLPACPPILSPRVAAVRQPALRVVIVGAIIYMREDIAVTGLCDSSKEWAITKEPPAESCTSVA